MRIFPLLLAILAPFACAGETALERFNSVMADPQQRQQAYAAGQERITLCGHCHGEDGNSKRDYIPNLAAQNPCYLFNAFEKYANGERSDYVMSRLAKTLSQEERVDIAVYFSQQDVRPAAGAVDEVLRGEGAVLFQQVCVACHGQQALGLENAPRLAGQPAEYLRRTLTGYREKDPRRAGSVMLGVAGQLADRQIAALAAYLQQLQP
ncbi:cytochrome c oxidase, cbb3-type, subunit III [compost metagenome]